MVHDAAAVDTSVRASAESRVVAISPVDRIVPGGELWTAPPIGDLIVRPSRASEPLDGELVEIGGFVVVRHANDASVYTIGKRRARLDDQAVERQMVRSAFRPVKHP